MKTLYLSDLDGTLLQGDGSLSERTVRAVRRFVEQGGLFSVATGRPYQMAEEILDRLQLNIPVLLGNGVALYHPVQKRYLQVFSLSALVVGRLAALFAKHRVSGFLYVLENGVIKVYHEELFAKEDRLYREGRHERYNGHFYLTGDFSLVAHQHTAMNFTLYSQAARVSDLYRELSAMPDIECTLTEDVYSENFYFLDVFSSQASKRNGMEQLCRLLGVGRVVAFGDNFNDLGMLEHADEAYVPQNAVGPARQLATGILESCNNDGVALYLERLMNDAKEIIP